MFSLIKQNTYSRSQLFEEWIKLTIIGIRDPLINSTTAICKTIELATSMIQTIKSVSHLRHLGLLKRKIDAILSCKGGNSYYYPDMVRMVASAKELKFTIAETRITLTFNEIHTLREQLLQRINFFQRSFFQAIEHTIVISKTLEFLNRYNGT